MARLRELLPQRSSLPQLMFAPFATQLLVAMALVLGLSYQMAGRIINQLTSELGSQIGERVLQEINTQLSAPRQVNAINARLLSSGLISPGRLLELGPLLQTELELFPGLGYVHLANPQGAYLALERNKQSDRLELSQQGPGPGTRPLPVFTIGAQGKPLDLIRTVPFDARGMVWFQDAIRNPLALSGFATPFGPGGEPLGVAGADIWPIQLTRFLQNLQIGRDAAVYIVDQRGLLVGSSSQQKLYSIVDGRLVRQRAVRASDPLVRGMAELMKPRFGEELAERRGINGKAYMLVTKMVNDPSGLAWQVVVATPEDNYLATAKATLASSLMLVLISFGVVMLVSRSTAKLVSQPLQRLSGAADAMAKGELDQRLEGSAIDEVNDLTLSFNSMAGQLRQSYGDLEALKNYQESILESMPSGVITFNEAGLVRTANQAGCRILQLAAEQLLGHSAQQLFAGRNAWLASQLAEVQASGESRQLLDTELELGAEQALSSANITLQPLQDPRLGTIGTILMLEDISEEKRIKGTMARYMDPVIAEQLLRSGADSLGGLESKATVLFSDIRSFTSITEVLGAQGTVRFLNDYFTLMVDCLQQEGGMLDKFIGDAIMAVFGLPIAGDDDEDHAIRAAIAMQEVLGHFNLERQQRGEQPIGIGIGLHTDAVVSGNIGSPKRMNYTVIGDGVNLASRLESACKFYGAKLLVSDATLRRAKGHYVSREADRVVVKGKSEPVLVHELLDFTTAASFPDRDQVLAHYQRGLSAYRQQRWAEGIAAFETALRLHGGDRLSAMYLERCKHLQAHNPGPNWDGVWVMDTK
jgi:PAS domain S-box-containing protein